MNNETTNTFTHFLFLSICVLANNAKLYQNKCLSKLVNSLQTTNMWTDVTCLQIHKSSLTGFLIWRSDLLKAGSANVISSDRSCLFSFSSGTVLESNTASLLWASTQLVPWKFSLVFKSFRQFPLRTFPSSVLTSYDHGPTYLRTVAFLFHASGSWILTTSSFAGGESALVALSYWCFYLFFRLSSLVRMSLFCFISMEQGKVMCNLRFINSSAGDRPHSRGAVM